MVKQFWTQRWSISSRYQICWWIRNSANQLLVHISLWSLWISTCQVVNAGFLCSREGPKVRKPRSKAVVFCVQSGNLGNPCTLQGCGFLLCLVWYDKRSTMINKYLSIYMYIYIWFAHTDIWYIINAYKFYIVDDYCHRVETWNLKWVEWNPVFLLSRASATTQGFFQIECGSCKNHDTWVLICNADIQGTQLFERTPFLFYEACSQMQSPLNRVRACGENFLA